MIASPLMRLLVLSLCALLVVSQLDIGDSDLTDIDGADQGFLGMLSRARPQFLKLQGGLSKRAQYSANDFSAAAAAKRRSKNARCMADFWKGRGLVNC